MGHRPVGCEIIDPYGRSKCLLKGSGTRVNSNYHDLEVELYPFRQFLIYVACENLTMDANWVLMMICLNGL